PVSVFPEGGGTSLPGVASIRSDFQGMTYYFASEENKTKFLANPDKYEPTYGGWCAYAMASGQKIPIDTRYVTIHGNRAHYFVSARA
ncbi:YHS domain-containing (seleno)protein, partial [Vibrio parahaemolyticus]